MKKFKSIYYFLYAYIFTKWKHLQNRFFPFFFQKWQRRKLNRQLNFIVKNSSYYGNLLGNKKNLKLSNFPIIDKNILMENLDSINTRRIQKVEAMELALLAEKSREFKNKLGDISYGLSSGTSGNRGLFLVSDKENAMWAGFILAKLGHFRKHKFKKIKIAFFMRANNNLYETIDSFKFNFKFFDIFKDFQENLQELDEFQANIIIAQPSIMKLLGKENEKHNKNYPLLETFTIAEVLEEDTKDYIEKVFKVPNYNIYQGTEGFLGSTYSDYRLYLNEDLVYIEKEYIDYENKVFIPIITDLYRSTQPIVRYRLNDILVEDNKTKGKYNFTMLKRIEGRSDEYFIFYKENEIIRIFPDFIRNSIIKNAIALIDYKVYQHSNDKVEILLNTKNMKNINIVKESFSDLLKNYNLSKIQVLCKVEEFKREQGLKLRRVFRNEKIIEV